MEGMVVFPGPIDIPRLRTALAKTLHDYPHTAGRLISEKGEWFIKLTNSPVPLTLATSQVHMTEELWQSRHPHCVDTLPWKFAPLANVDEPLMKIKITTWPKTGETSLGFTWLHVLGAYTNRTFLLRASSNHGLQETRTPSFCS